MVIPVTVLFFIFSLLLFVDNREQRIKKVFPFLCLVWLALSLIAAFRPEYMADRENYLLFWNGLGEERFEIGFTLMAECLRNINDNFYFFLFCSAAFSIALKLTAICRISPLIWGSLLIYVTYIFVLHDMIQMRCAIASGFLLHAVYYTVNRNFKRFAIVAAIAFMFHYSAILIFPLWLINTTRPQRKIYIPLIFLSYILSMAGICFSRFLEYVPIEGLMNIFLRTQQTMGDKADIFNAIQMGRIAICLLMFMHIETIYTKNRFAILLVKIYAISVAVLPLFADLQIVAYRVSQLYQVVEIVLIPMLVYSLRGFEILKRFGVVIIGTAFLLMSIFSLEYLK